MTRKVKICNLTRENSTGIQAEYCSSYQSRFWGLMGKRSIQPTEGVLLVESHEDRINTSIHMFFMAFDIFVVWINKEKVIVDSTIAKRWRPAYIPSRPAQYTLELHVDQSSNFMVGDRLEFEVL